MAKRITYSPEEKKELIKNHLPEYLASNKTKIDGKKATKELFDGLTEEEQWKKIYIGYVRKPKQTKDSSDDRFTYRVVSSAITTLKKSIDIMNDQQIEKMFTDLEQLPVLVDNKAERAKQIELQKISDEKKELTDRIKELDELEKTLSKN